MSTKRFELHGAPQSKVMFSTRLRREAGQGKVCGQKKGELFLRSGTTAVELLTHPDLAPQAQFKLGAS
jgi:hypothetical protein